MIENVNHPMIGLMPSDWNASRLSDIIDLIHGFQFRKEDFTDEGIAVVKINNVIGNSLKLENLSFIDSNRLEEFSRYIVAEGDILMSLTGNIGRVIEVGSLQRIFIQNYRVGKFVPANGFEISKRYIKYLLSSPFVLNQFFKFSNQSAQANFGKQDMDKVWVVVPKNFEEQQKIAEILSTVDDKIDVIDQQISETQTLKKGLMQRLLTKGIGHTEFKDSPLGEIPKSWEVYKLNEVADIASGGTPSRSNPNYWNGNIPWVTTSLIRFNYISNSEELITELAVKNSSARLFPKGTILMAMYGQGVTRGKVAVLDIEATTNQACSAIISNPKLYNIFLFYCLMHRYEELRTLSNAGSQENLSGTIIKNLNIQIPSLFEQKKIANILSSVDEKLEVLSDKKTHYQELKQGLMQQLLTGKIRVNGSINKPTMS